MGSQIETHSSCLQRRHKDVFPKPRWLAGEVNTNSYASTERERAYREGCWRGCYSKLNFRERV